MAKQYTNTLMMVRPASFQFNFETAASNAFQKSLAHLNSEEIILAAKNEFDAYVKTLRNIGLEVLVVEDTINPQKPDAIFPNNWISTDTNGNIFLFPMYSANRRLERENNAIELLQQQFVCKNIVDLSFNEDEGIFLEGTGSMIFDHIHRIAYACLSPRTHNSLFIQYCNMIDYKPISFAATDSLNKEIYHTNVILTISDRYSIICTQSIKYKVEEIKVINSLLKTGHEIIDITYEQMNAFAGNMLQVGNEDENFLIMSKTALSSLTQSQIKIIEKYSTIVAVDISTIETIGGGSARCMLAEIFLEKKS
jgi:hypothetical protein